MANNRKRHKPYANPAAKTVVVEGDAAVLARAIEELGLAPDTLQLLQNNKFVTVMDIAKRTEREMFKIQTFNKKHLLEVKSKINAVGINFLPPVVFEPKPEAVKAEGERRPQERAQSAQPQKERRPEQNGKPRAEQNKQRPEQNGKQRTEQNGKQRPDNRQNQQNAKQAKPQPERLPKVKLPLEEWRKVTKNGKWGFSDGLTTVIQPKFDEVFSFKDGLACVEVDEMFGYINPEGEFVIEPMYECAMSFSEGLAVVFEKEKCGYINKENVKVIDCKFDAATAFENGRAKVKEDGKWGTIAPDGTTLWSK